MLKYIKKALAEKMFLTEVNAIGIKNFAHMEYGRSEIYELRLANGVTRYWGTTNPAEFEKELRMVDK